MNEKPKMFVNEAADDAELAHMIISQLEECDREIERVANDISESEIGHLELVRDAENIESDFQLFITLYDPETQGKEISRETERHEQFLAHMHRNIEQNGKIIQAIKNIHRQLLASKVRLQALYRQVAFNSSDSAH